MSIKIQGCTVNDATALARNNMSAFWPDSTWRLSFKDRALEDVITECTKRIPTTLLTDRITKRHQKVVDIHAETVMGYARWIMPDRVTSQWLEAQTPAVTVSEEKEYETLFSSANWIRPTDITGLGAPLESIMNRLMSGKEYIGKSSVL